MSPALFFALYCVVCFIVSGVTLRLVRIAWLYFLISATIPASLYIGGASLWRGHLNAWSDVAFVLSWFLALGCAIVYYVIRQLAAKEQPSEEKRSNSEPHD